MMGQGDVSPYENIKGTDVELQVAEQTDPVLAFGNSNNYSGKENIMKEKEENYE